jgi:hypothetical protein
MFIELISNSRKYNSSFNFTLIDTEFVEERDWIAGNLWATIIDVYEMRNMNVEKNLVLAIKYCEKTYYNGMIEVLITNCYNVKNFKEKYGKEFDKYLMLM